MLKLARVRLNQFLEIWKSEGFSTVRKKVLFFNKTVIPAVKDLSRVAPVKVSDKTADVGFVEIVDEHFLDRGLRFPTKSRGMRVGKNLKKGYRGFAIIRGDEVVGDMWYCTGGGPDAMKRHPDLEWFAWFGVDLGEKDVCMFEMYVKPEERGGGLVNILHGSALMALKDKGYERVYGYCTIDNLPALWVHRVMGYKELGRLKMHRVGSFTRRSLKEDGRRRVMVRFFDLS